jgi:molybdopterin synthase sulfur carrier subunit
MDSSTVTTADTEVTVRFWASVRSAAGVVEDRFPAGTVAELLTEVGHRYPATVELLPRCSILLDAMAVHDLAGSGQSRRVKPGATMEVLPPFAGG